MTKVVDEVWWLYGIARREVNGIYKLLPEQWLGNMDWPMRIANHEGPMNDEIWGVTVWDGELDEFKGSGEEITSHIDMLAELMNSCAPPMPVD